MWDDNIRCALEVVTWCTACVAATDERVYVAV